LAIDLAPFFHSLRTNCSTLNELHSLGPLARSVLGLAAGPPRTIPHIGRRMNQSIDVDPRLPVAGRFAYEGVQGVVFRRSIRASYATLDLEVRSFDTGNEDAACGHVIVLVQFSFDNNKSEGTLIRSYIRRNFKLGDEVQIVGGKWLDEGRNAGAAYQKLEVAGFVVPSPNAANDADVRLVQRQAWDNIRCQEARAKYIPFGEEGEEKQTKRTKKEETADSKAIRHGGGIGKRRQGEVIAAFLIERVALTKFNGSRDEAIAYLNSGTGCVDAAGGSGHVSLALSLQGVKSTVVDPRPSVGRLPKRDRKALKKALKRHKASEDAGNNSGEHTEATRSILHPPVPFSTFRAWFGTRPDGVDLTYREGTRNEEHTLEARESTEAVPICHMCSSDEILPNCSAIIALHPDEATGVIVEHAVKHRIPFAVVPCCVFSRVFNNRYKANGLLVQTYEDLIEWLVAKDPSSIRVDNLPFDGANKVLWATFE